MPAKQCLPRKNNQLHPHLKSNLGVDCSLPAEDLSHRSENRPLARPHHAFAQVHPSSLERARTRSTRYRPAFRRRKTPCSPRRRLHARTGLRPFNACALCRTSYHRECQQDGRIGRHRQPTSSDSKSSLLPIFKPMRTPFAASLGSSVTTMATILSRLNFYIPRRTFGLLISLVNQFLIVPIRIRSLRSATLSGSRTAI